MKAGAPPWYCGEAGGKVNGAEKIALLGEEGKKHAPNE